MPNNYQFLDAYSSVQTARSSFVGGGHEQYIQISSVLVPIPVISSGNQSVSGTVNIGNVPSVNAVIANVPSVNAVISGGNASISGIVGASIIGTVPVTQSGVVVSSALSYLTRNDAVTSFLGADLTQRPGISDSAGRTIIKPFAADDSATFRYTASIYSASVLLVQASVTGKRFYVTDVWATNTGSVTTRVDVKDGANNFLMHTIAPATGGSNSPGIAIPPRTAATSDLLVQANALTSVLYVTINGYTAP